MSLQVLSRRFPACTCLRNGFKSLSSFQYDSSQTAVTSFEGLKFKRLQQFSRGHSKTAGKIPNFGYSGDLTKLKPLDPNELVYRSKTLKDMITEAPESVKHINSIKFASGQEKKYHTIEELFDRMTEMFGRDCALEQKIARETVSIRLMMQHCEVYTKDRYTKGQLVEKIQMRKKLLKFLQRKDYERFLWLLRELRIRYVPLPEYHGRVTKKMKVLAEARESAAIVRRAKLDALKEKLAAEREEFEKEKAKILEQIENDIGKLKLDRESFEKYLQRTKNAQTEGNSKFDRVVKG